MSDQPVSSGVSVFWSQTFDADGHHEAWSMTELHANGLTITMTWEGTQLSIIMDSGGGNRQDRSSTAPTMPIPDPATERLFTLISGSLRCRQGGGPGQLRRRLLDAEQHAWDAARHGQPWRPRNDDQGQ